jgi:hypothetical protein
MTRNWAAGERRGLSRPVHLWCGNTSDGHCSAVQSADAACVGVDEEAMTTVAKCWANGIWIIPCSPFECLLAGTFRHSSGPARCIATLPLRMRTGNVILNVRQLAKEKYSPPRVSHARSCRSKLPTALLNDREIVSRYWNDCATCQSSAHASDIRVEGRTAHGRRRTAGHALAPAVQASR